MKRTMFFGTVFFWIVWIGAIAYATLLAPPTQPDTWTLIQAMSLGQWEGINPLIIALFYIMGVIPLVYACLMVFDGRGQRIPAWPFIGASFGVGAFAILPYLALRRPNSTFTGEKNWQLRILESRWMGGAIALSILALLSIGIIMGNWQDFLSQWRTSRFIHVMSLDFCLSCLLLPVLVGDDLKRRGIPVRRVFWLIALIPLFGTLAYLVWRPPIASDPELRPNVDVI